MGLLVENTSRL